LADKFVGLTPIIPFNPQKTGCFRSILKILPPPRLRPRYGFGFGGWSINKTPFSFILTFTNTQSQTALRYGIP
jgi:hypothetical protein